MARIFGLNGLIRGRQGNNVFSIQNGTQVLKAYNPAVSNPRTLGQREQRSKFALAGKMSAATPSAAIIGMRGESNRARRAKFVSLLVNNAIVSASENGLQASVLYEQIKFSLGSLSQYSNVPTVTASWGGATGRSFVSVQVPSSTLAPSAPQGYGELAVVCLFDEQSSQLDEVQVQRRDFSTANTYVFRFGERRNVRAVTYIVPFAASSRAISLGVSNIFESETSINVIANVTDGASLVDFGESILISSIPVLGATTSVAPSPDDDMRGLVEDGLMSTAVAPKKKK